MGYLPNAKLKYINVSGKKLNQISDNVNNSVWTVTCSVTLWYTLYAMAKHFSAKLFLSFHISPIVFF